MVKKLILCAAIALGLLYGSGSNLGAVKRAITGAANDNARSVTQSESSDWGTGSGY